MKVQGLIPVVEIVTRAPFKSHKRPATPGSPQAVSPNNISRRKKAKLRSKSVEPDDNTDCASEVEERGLCYSPTVSDFGRPGGNELPHSPTISDFAMLESSPTLSTTNLTLNSGEECSVLLQTPPSIRRELSPELGVPPELGRNSTEDVLVYEIMDGELIEDADLAIPGEVSLDDAATADNSQDDDIPVRLLQDFTIYNMATNEVVPVAELLSLKFSSKFFCASGVVTAWADNTVDDEDDSSDILSSDSGERVKLSQILELNVHDCSQRRELDSKIYIRTKYAWYILDNPSISYKPFFVPFWIQHQVLHLLVTSSLDMSRITYEEFIDSLDSMEEAGNENSTTYPFFKVKLKRQDVESDDIRAYIMAVLPDLCAENDIHISHVPLVQTILGPFVSDLIISEGRSAQKRKPKIKASRRSKVSMSNDKEKEVLRHRNMTVVTPIVSCIAKNLFKGSLEVAGTVEFNDRDQDVATQIDSIQAHHSDPRSMQWGEQTIDEESGEKIYKSVIMDGVSYYAGDDVMVNPGYDEDMIRARNSNSDAAQSANLFANRLWFCRICYFFEQVENGKNVKMFHGQWFTHGSKTILQETAHSKSLYFTNKCESNPTASIFQKCNVRMMSPGDEEVPDDGRPDANDFHCSLVWSDENSDFVDLPSTAKIQQLLSLTPGKPCISCAIGFEEDQHSELRHITGGFTQHGITYHIHDFVYIQPDDKSTNVLEIGQIIKMRNIPADPIISVQCLGRYDDYLSEERQKTEDLSTLISDERRLYLQNKTKNITPGQIDGICYVQHLINKNEIEQWISHDDHFYLNQKRNNNDSLNIVDSKELESCVLCYNARVQSLEYDQGLRAKNEPLRSLELFSGAGGLGTGMDMSGFVETKYAVEFSPSAAITYRTNHPQAVVYCQDSSLLLKHAIETDGGKKPKPLLSNDGSGYCQPMPTKGDIDMIQGGPPCQSFSLANHHRRADDIRSTLPGNMLSYVEHYDPKYFLLENVKGLLDYPLMSSAVEGSRALEGGIKGGMIKFIMRTLEALGYQVRYKLLQAGQYGAPQGRMRVIFWGAKRGLQIPDFPVPVYAFPKGVHRCTLPTGSYMLPVSRSLIQGNSHQYAPLRPITVNDAISDLPPFEWKSPHNIIAANPRQRADVRARSKNLGILQCEAVLEGRNNDLPGFPDGVEYKTKPMNRYQKWIRAGTGSGDNENLVQGHYTKRFGPNLVEATVAVPLKPWADHRDIPIPLRPDHAKPGAKQANRSFYGRMDANGHFKCAMTSLAPNIKNSWVLHPSQKRIISVRECARAQGFPDHYIFKSADGTKQKMVENQVRQIGNAVPVPLALALGKALGKVLLKEWAKREREGSPVV